MIRCRARPGVSCGSRSGASAVLAAIRVPPGFGAAAALAGLGVGDDLASSAGAVARVGTGGSGAATGDVDVGGRGAQAARSAALAVSRAMPRSAARRETRPDEETEPVPSASSGQALSVAKEDRRQESGGTRGCLDRSLAWSRLQAVGDRSHRNSMAACASRRRGDRRAQQGPAERRTVGLRRRYRRWPGALWRPF